MATVKHKNHFHFHWTPSEFILSLLFGIAAIGALWLLSGLLVGMFFL